MLSWKKLKPVVAVCCCVTGIYYSPHFFARFCVHEGRMLSRESIVEQAAAWLIERKYPHAKFKSGGIFFGDDHLVERGEVLVIFETGKFGLWNPLKPDYPNHLYVYTGGADFFIFDACGTLVAIRG